MILAAIDIGSNAARMLIMEVEGYKGGEADFTKLNFLRIPLRLGFEVFTTGSISEEKKTMILDTMVAYQQLAKIYQVEHMRACATSAMRDASNGSDIIKEVKDKTNIAIEIISGAEEASILYETHIAEKLSANGNYVYMDVGGGSTEITIFSKNMLHAKASFNIGTIRLLTGSVKEETWEEMKDFLKNTARPLSNIQGIGSGGNINKIFSLSKTKDGKPLSLELLRDYQQQLGSSTVAERMHLYSLRQDRADVIVPALQIYTSALKWAGATEIFVPKIGLADGLIRQLYNKTMVANK